MDGTTLDPFPAHGMFAANPHLYDYIHNLEFDSDGTVEMVDGAGQVLNTLVKGRFSIGVIDQSAARVRFHDLAEYDPHDEREAIQGLTPISVTVSREEGLFAFRQQVVWRVSDQSEWPCLLYRVRYVFDIDPLASLASNRDGNLYYIVDAQEPDSRYYYPRDAAEKLTLRELEEMGLSI